LDKDLKILYHFSIGNKLTKKYAKPEDNVRVKIAPNIIAFKLPNKENCFSVCTAEREPLAYRSFDLLMDSVITDVKGNILTIDRKEGVQRLYVEGCSGVVYLTEVARKVDDASILKEVIGKRIDLVQKKYLPGDMERDLPFDVKIGSPDLPYCYQLFDIDGLIISKEPSVRYSVNYIKLFSKKGYENLKTDEIEGMKRLREFCSTNPQGSVNYFEDELAKHPEFLKKLFGE
jgi:hypothetical protein